MKGGQGTLLLVCLFAVSAADAANYHVYRKWNPAGPPGHVQGRFGGEHSPPPPECGDVESACPAHGHKPDVNR